MRVVTIEDEINAYEYLISLLQKIDTDIKVVAHHESVKKAVNYFQNNNDYDLVFMDIQIADGLSFEIFNHVNLDKPVIFTTAYDEYAIEAFKVHSVDYLLKPISLDDLKRSIEKFKNIFDPVMNPSTENLMNVIRDLNRPKKNRCLVKKGGHYEYINVTDIAYVNSEDSLTFLHTFDGSRYIYSKTVEQLFSELDHNEFFQINRSQIVQSNALKEIHPFLNQRLKLILNLPVSADSNFIVSRQRLTSFKEWLDR